MRGVLIHALPPFRVHADPAVTLAFPENPKVTPGTTGRLFTAFPAPTGLQAAQGLSFGCFARIRKETKAIL